MIEEPEPAENTDLDKLAGGEVEQNLQEDVVRKEFWQSYEMHHHLKIEMGVRMDISQVMHGCAAVAKDVFKDGWQKVLIFM